MSDDSSIAAGSIDCPVCGASQKTPGSAQGYACRRCRADLQALIQTRRTVALHAISAFAAIRRGDSAAATTYAARLEWLDPKAAALLQSTLVGTDLSRWR